MERKWPSYRSGGAVHAKDRIRYKGTAGRVVFVSDGDREEFATGYAEYQGHEAGIMISDDDGELTFFREADEELVLVHPR